VDSVVEVGDDAVVVGLVAALVAEPKNHKKVSLFHHFCMNSINFRVVI